MKMKTTLIIIIFLLQGCSSYKIYTASEHGEKCTEVEPCNENTKAKSSKIVTTKGIPFFVHKEITKQKTIRTRKWLNAKFVLQVLEDNKINPKLGKTFYYKVGMNHENSNELLNIANKVIDQLDENNVSEVEESIREKLVGADIFITNKDLLCESSSQTDSSHVNNLTKSLISNTFESVVTIDYKKKYYFNTRIYPFSKNDSSITISDKGTLTEAKNNVDTTELKDLIPLKEFLTDKLNIEVESNPSPVVENDQQKMNIKRVSDNKTTYKLIVTTKIDGFKYELTKYHDDDITMVNYPPLEISNNENSIIRSRLNAIKAKKAEEKPKDDNSYKISGSITVPKT